MKTIAVIDDDIHISNMLTELLEKHGYKVIRAYSGTEALYLLSENRPDLILLDLMLPGLSGEDVLGKIQGIPVIVISAKCDTDSKVNLLISGACDYITKPFDTRELLARITVSLRNAAGAVSEGKISAGGLVLDETAHEAFYNGEQIKMTRTEYAVLKLLAANAGKTVARSFILEKISYDTPDCTEDSLKQHISNLRSKIRKAGGDDVIEAVWGIGYKLRTE